MSFDLNWLWDTLNNITGTIQSWFGGIWNQVTNIVNAGQGIFSGLAAFGSQIWDAIIKAFSALGEAIKGAFAWIWQGLLDAGKALGEWIGNAYQWVASGLQWITTGLNNIGQWLWNGMWWMWDTIRNALIGLWNWITSALSGVANAISSWWSRVIQGINTWFTNLLKVFRQKIITTIMVDVGITGMWKAGERILHPSNLKDIGYGLLGLALSPLVGYTIGKFVDAIVPLPSTDAYPLIPTITGFEYTPPSITIETPPTPTPPTPPATPPSPPFPGAGLPYDVSLKFIGLHYDYTTLTRDGCIDLPSITSEAYTESTDGDLSPPSITYEYEIS